jgi:hypothetical protein
VVLVVWQKLAAALKKPLLLLLLLLQVCRRELCWLCGRDWQQVRAHLLLLLLLLLLLQVCRKEQ